MKPANEGELGLLVVQSEAVMLGYVDEPEATKSVRQDDWYLGLGDVVFYLTNQDTGARDYYWVSRSAGLMIRGGANYSCVQVETELREFCVTSLQWPADGFDLAVVGHKLGSEHEDACCVLLELRSSMAKEPEIYAQELMREAPMKVSKGAKPDRIAFGVVPRNFKGATVRPDVRVYFENCLQDEPSQLGSKAGEKNG
jgi:acyl-CoA synthetase (AMP-forming)/AMP-acid ligase II